MIEIVVDTIKGKKNELVYNVDDFPYSNFKDLPTETKKHIEYYNLPVTFDIEATTIDGKKDSKGKYLINPYGFMYHWQVCVDNIVCFGRYWNEFLIFLKRLKKTMYINSNRILVIYVHNLAYEFQFIKDFFEWESIFAKDKRKPIKAVTSCGIEFRCSFFLSNMSLERFCENTDNVTYYKNDGDYYDYRKIRTPSYQMSNMELAYCYNDVRGLAQCIRELLKEDSITKIPLTNTGYVRRDYRRVMNTKQLYNTFIKTRLNAEQYLYCYKAFRGGNTHANRFLSGKILQEIYSCDIESSYPAVIAMCDNYPIGKFTEVTLNSLEKIDYYCSNYAVVMYVEFFDLAVKENNVIPYIPLSKCEKVCDIINDNGRILSAKYCSMYITNIDLDIIRNTYYINNGYYVVKAFYTKKGKLPKELRIKMMEYYINKTELKGFKEKEYFYLKSKNKLNSTFGMMVTDICHSEISYDGNEWLEEKPDIQEALDSFYNNRNSFLSYQWGIFVTANARKALQDMLDIIQDDVVYVDTDSIKFIDEKHFKEFEYMNKLLINRAMENDIPTSAIDKKGNVHYLGLWDLKDGAYKRFKTYGAKKYCYEDMENNTFHITVAGMNKEKGAKKIKSCDNFNLFETYHDIGRTTSWYNNEPIREITVDGETFLSASNIGILETTYTLGVTQEYWELIGENVLQGIDKEKFYNKLKNNY